MSMSNLSAPTAGLNDFLGGNLTNFVNIGELRQKNAKK
jgi:hypothetical protein